MERTSDRRILSGSLSDSLYSLPPSRATSLKKKSQKLSSQSKRMIHVHHHVPIPS